MLKPTDRIMISIRLTRSLLERVEKYVAKSSPIIRDRTQAIEVALERLLSSPPQKQ
jgi:hypothetical protein